MELGRLELTAGHGGVKFNFIFWRNYISTFFLIILIKKMFLEFEKNENFNYLINKSTVQNACSLNQEKGSAVWLKDYGKSIPHSWFGLTREPFRNHVSHLWNPLPPGKGLVVWAHYPFSDAPQCRVFDSCRVIITAVDSTLTKFKIVFVDKVNFRLINYIIKSVRIFLGYYTELGREVFRRKNNFLQILKGFCFSNRKTDWKIWFFDSFFTKNSLN